MNTMNEPLASKYVETFNFPEYSREEHLSLSKERWEFGFIFNIHLQYIYTISILKCFKLEHEM